MNETENLFEMQLNGCENCKKLLDKILELENIIQEKNYYGSDLNKFIDEKCTHKMTCINIDALIFRRSKNKLRIIESKHLNENMKWGQEEVLKLMGKVFAWLNRLQEKIDFSVHIVYGNYPYEKLYIVDLTNIKDGIEYSGEEVIKYLELEF